MRVMCSAMCEHSTVIVSCRKEVAVPGVEELVLGRAGVGCDAAHRAEGYATVDVVHRDCPMGLIPRAAESATVDQHGNRVVAVEVLTEFPPSVFPAGRKEPGPCYGGVGQAVA